MFAVELQRTDTNFREIFDEVLTQLGERAQQTAIERYNLKQQQIAEKSNVLQVDEGRRVTDATMTLIQEDVRSDEHKSYKLK